MNLLFLNCSLDSDSAIALWAKDMKCIILSQNRKRILRSASDMIEVWYWCTTRRKGYIEKCGRCFVLELHIFSPKLYRILVPTKVYSKFPVGIIPIQFCLWTWGMCVWLGGRGGSADLNGDKARVSDDTVSSRLVRKYFPAKTDMSRGTFTRSRM